MDCSACGERVGVAGIICQHCGFRLPAPVPASAAPQPFDRSHWAVLPPFPRDADRSATTLGTLVFQLFLGFLDG